MSSWFSLLFFELGARKEEWKQNLLGYMSLFSALFSCGVLLEIFNFCQIKSSAASYGQMYINLIDNLQLFFVLSFLIALAAFRTTFEKRVLLLAASCYIIGGALVSGAVWELFEFYWYGTKMLAEITSLHIYEDTIRDLVMDGLGGLAFLSAASFNGNLRRL